MATLGAAGVPSPGRTERPRPGAVRVRVRLLWILSLLLPATLAAQPGAPLEYQVKASYIYNLIQFVEWPPAHIGEEYRICVLGAHRFRGALDALEGARVNDRALKIRHLDDTRQAAHCEVLFIADSEAGRAEPFLRMAPQPGLLTIGETRDFIARGGVIGLVKVHDKVKFVINEDAAARAGLKISAQLLRLAGGQ